MIDKNDVICFFDHCAQTWDEEMIRNDNVIEKILDNAGVRQGVTVLDVACGTGVLFPDYISRGVKSVVGIDISPEMASRAAVKHPDSVIKVICGDVEEYRFENEFDVIVVYNAFPHFPDPVRLIQKLASLVKDGGRLTIAHGMSREKIDSHHKGAASKVSNGLMPAEALKQIFDAFFNTDIVISNHEMYQVSGIKRSSQP